MTQVLDPDFSSLLVQHKSQVAKDIWCFRLVHPVVQSLPVFKAGAHITVQTPAGQRRNYSLCNDPAETIFCGIAHEAGKKRTGWLAKTGGPSSSWRFTQRLVTPN